MSESSFSVRKGPGALLVVLVCAALIAVGYSLHEWSVARQRTAQNAQLNASLQQARSDLAALKTQVNSMSESQRAQAAPSQFKPPAASGTHSRSMPASHRAHRPDDPRWKKVQSQLDEQGKQIESNRNDLASTRNDLASAKTELSGSIARTHDELVVLQKKGERNYYEFDLAKSKEFNRSGPVGISLRKANTKHQYADLQLMVDDVDLTRKHVNLYEPVMFYTADGAQPAELVINSITKDHIRGYISEPKYRKSELAAMSNAATQNSAGTGTNDTGEMKKRLQLSQ